MTTTRLYYSSSELTTLATVLEIGHDERGTWVVPDKTVAHVKGGGQRGDRGTIGGVAFKDVLASDGRDGAACHVLEGTAPFLVGAEVEIRVDPEWRRRQAASHNGGHLVAALVETHFPGLRAVSAHHYEGEARVEFIGEAPSDLGALQGTLATALQLAISGELPIRIVGDPFSNRAIQIAEYPPVPCGGTHPPSTRDLVGVKITRVKNKDGKLRISYEMAAAATG